MKLKIMASCALLALAACASQNQPQTYSDAKAQIPAVYFGFNSVELNDASKTTLSESMAAIENKKDLELVITGYADMYGNDAVNKTVSRKRAQSVKEYLSDFSIPADQMKVEAKGKSELRTTDPDAQDAERRVEIQVVKGGAVAGAAAGNNAKDKATKDAAQAAKSKKDADQSWFGAVFDCMCED